MGKIRIRTTEVDALLKLNKNFAYEMHKRIMEKEHDGWSGWEDKIQMLKYAGGIKERIIKNALEGDWIDVANLAMFAWNHDLK